MKIKSFFNKTERKKRRKEAHRLRTLEQFKGLIVIDFGCKKDKIPGALGVDIDPSTDAEVIHDLSIYPYPFKENYADRIFAKHIIEHLSDTIGFIKEIHRILKPGGSAYIETPHFSNYVAYAEPQHKAYYSYFMFKTIFENAKVDFKILRLHLHFYKTFRFFGIQLLANKSPESYEHFWTYLFPAETIILEIVKI